MSRVWSLLRSQPFVSEGLVLLVAMGLVLLFQLLYAPRVRTIDYVYANTNRHAETLPISIRSSKNYVEMDIQISMSVWPFQATQFLLRADDCLELLSINDTEVPIATPCIKNMGRTYELQLGGYMKYGENTIHAKVQDVKQGKVGLSFEPSPNDLGIVLSNLLLLLLPMLYLISIVHKTVGKNFPTMTIAVVAGFALRIIYAAITHYTVRQYDLDGHIEYIEYVTRLWSIPVSSGGWEFHQAPLFYYMSAILMKTAYILGYGRAVALEWIQNLSTYLSCITLLAAAWCGSIVFPKNQRSQLLFAAVFATFPGIVAFSSRITNDALYQLAALLFLGCLLQWWKSGKTQWLILTVLAICFGLLTKANSFLFLPVFITCVAFYPKATIRTKLRWLAIAAGTIVILTGWLLALRYVQNGFGKMLTPSNGGMSGGLVVENSWAAYLWFNPIHLITVPFTNSWVDGSGREYFWMYLFKSSLFGEFSYSQYRGITTVGSLLAMLHLGSLAIAFKGVVRSFKKKDLFLLPIAVTFIIIIDGALMFRAIHSYSCNQDFRFSILLLPLLALCAVRGSEGDTYLEKICRAWLIAFAVCSVIFFAILSIGGIPKF